jgi:predicted membrane protein
MNAASAMWVVLRITRWLLTFVFIAYALHMYAYRSNYIDQFGHLFLWAELMLFAIPGAAVAAGFLELMVREKAGIARPALGRWRPAPAVRGQVGGNR